MNPTTTGIAGITSVSIPVQNQDDALRFYTEILGFTLVLDTPTPGGGRFIQLAPGAGGPVVTLEPASPDLVRGTMITIRFTTGDAARSHAALTTAGVDTDEVLRWPGVPAMFGFRDPDGNAFSLTEAPADHLADEHGARSARRP